MSAVTIANYLVYILALACNDLTNMKINKLLRFVQGFYFKEYGEPIFDEDFVAAARGPLLLSVYTQFMKYGDHPIDCHDTTGFNDITPCQESILFDVATWYGRNTAGNLRNLTHAPSSPWHNIYSKNRMGIIPKSLIREYFAHVNPPVVPEREYTEDNFIGYHDANGAFVLPKEWDDETI